MRLLLVFILYLTVNALEAQTKLSLSDCYLIASRENIKVQIAQNEIRINELNRSTAKFQLLPSLSYDMNHYFSFGKNIDPATNTFSFEQFSGGEMGLGMRMTIFSGFRNILSIKEETYRVNAAEFEKQAIQLDIWFRITELYSQYTLLQEKINVVKNNITSIKNELEIIYEKIEIGRLAKYEAYAFEARLDTEMAELIQLNNSSNILLQQIKEILNLPYEDEISLASIRTEEIDQLYNLPLNQTDIIERVLISHPLLGLQSNEIKASEIVLKKASRSFYPTLRAGASVLSNYSLNMGENRLNEIPIENQIRNNIGQYVSIGLSIPIFTQMENFNRIRIEKVNKHTAQLQLIETKNAIVSNTIQLLNDFISSKELFSVTSDAWEKNKLSYSLQEEKYRLGKISSVELLTARDMLNASNASYLQSKLALYFRYQLLVLIDAV